MNWLNMCRHISIFFNLIKEVFSGGHSPLTEENEILMADLFAAPHFFESIADSRAPRVHTIYILIPPQAT